MEELNGDLGAMVEKLMKDPQVASLVGRLKEETAKEAEEEREDGQETVDREALGRVLEKLGPILGAGGNPGREAPDMQNRNRLLSALKPYLNRERREMIDKVTSVSSLTSLIEPLLRGSGK